MKVYKRLDYLNLKNNYKRIFEDIKKRLGKIEEELLCSNTNGKEVITIESGRLYTLKGSRFAIGYSFSDIIICDLKHKTYVKVDNISFFLSKDIPVAIILYYYSLLKRENLNTVDFDIREFEFTGIFANDQLLEDVISIRIENDENKLKPINSFSESEVFFYCAIEDNKKADPHIYVGYLVMNSTENTVYYIHKNSNVQIPFPRQNFIDHYFYNNKTYVIVINGDHYLLLEFKNYRLRVDFHKLKESGMEVNIFIPNGILAAGPKALIHYFKRKVNEISQDKNTPVEFRYLFTKIKKEVNGILEKILFSDYVRIMADTIGYSYIREEDLNYYFAMEDWDKYWELRDIMNQYESSLKHFMLDWIDILI